MIKVRISGILHNVRSDSIDIEARVEERSVASLIVDDPGNQFQFVKGEPLSVGNLINAISAPFFGFNFLPFNLGGFVCGIGESVIFNGVVESSQKVMINDTHAQHIVNAVDYHYYADKRLAARGFENEPIEDIVTELHALYLDSEGVTIGTIDSGFTIKEETFNYIPVSQALDRLADRVGYWWDIDQDKQLNFRARQSVIAPFTLTNADVLERRVSLKQDNTKYRNQQVLRDVRDITSPQTEDFTGDGVRTTYTVAYPLARAPQVFISNDGITYTPQTIGIRGVETGKDWYWSAGDSNISQDFDTVPLSTTQFLQVIYQGEIRLVIITNDQAQIIAQQSVEQQGTGIVENAITETNLTTREASFEYAGQLLEKYGQIGRQFNFTTTRSGLRIGQLLNVNAYGINEEMLIESIRTYFEGQNIFYDVTAIAGVEQRSWTDFFNNLYIEAQSKERTAATVGEIVIVPYQFEKDWLETENPNIFKEVYPIGQAPSATLFPSFDPEDRVKFLEWTVSNTPVERKAITQQSGTTTLTSITILAPADAAGLDITSFRWIGGIEASLAIGTGIAVDEQNETISADLAPWDKSSLESWQVEKVDRKWS